jgi:hypothetical protein
LTTDQGADSQWEAIENGTLEGWLVDWTNSRVYVRKKSASGDVDVSENSGGNVKLTMTAAHGLVEGDRFAVSGHSVGAYNVPHKVIEAVSNVAVKTDAAYMANGNDGTWTTATAPISGEYSASLNLNSLLDLVSCDHLILDGLAFDMCHSGQQVRVTLSTSQSDGGTPAKVRFTTSGGARHQLAAGDTARISGHSVTAYNGSWTVTNVVDPGTFDVDRAFDSSGGSGGSVDPQHATRLVSGSAALRLWSCSNVVVRNCVFTLAGVSSSNNANSLLTIEDSSFTGQNLFVKFIGTATTLNQLTMWNPVKQAERNETSDIVLSQHGGNSDGRASKRLFSRLERTQRERHCWQ